MRVCLLFKRLLLPESTVVVNVYIPGPLDPPCRRRPSRNITALSYSCTTLKQTQREKGSVTRTRPHEIIVRSRPHRPTPLSDSSAENNTKNRHISYSFRVHKCWPPRPFVLLETVVIITIKDN